jgi:fatty acid amide hydrolase
MRTVFILNMMVEIFQKEISNMKTISTTKRLTELSAVELASLIAQGDVTSQDVIEAHIERIEQVNPKLNAVVVKRYQQARTEAKEMDARRARGEKLGPLHGVPMTIKESIDLKDTSSTFGLEGQKNNVVKQDSNSVARLREAGAIILGKTNVAQLLLYYESDNPVYGRTNNPWNLERTPGGSSGGEAAIIASGGSPIGIGTDLGGSLRIPATFCGTVSLKPTTGRLNDPGRYSVPIGQRAIISQIGPMARSVEDVAKLLEILNNGNVEPPLPLGDYRKVDISNLRIGYYSNDGIFAPAPAIQRTIKDAVDTLQKYGAQVVEWTPPQLPEAAHLFFAILSADGFANFHRLWNGGKRDPRANTLAMLAGMPAPMRLLVSGMLKASGQKTMGSFLQHFGHTHTDQYWQLIEAQMDYQQRFAQALDRDGIDIILCPACPLPAFTHGASNELGTAGTYAMLYNLLGYPAGVVPFSRVGKSEEIGRKDSKDTVEKIALKVEQNSAGLPVGVQVVARPWREHIGLAVMSAIEKEAGKREDFPVNPII